MGVKKSTPVDEEGRSLRLAILFLGAAASVHRTILDDFFCQSEAPLPQHNVCLPKGCETLTKVSAAG